MGKPKLKAPLGGSPAGSVQTTTSLFSLERNVRFSFSDCDTNKFCIRKLSNEQIEKFYQRMGHLEEFTWQQIRQVPHEKGFSEEKKESENFKTFSDVYPSFSSFFHFRVTGLSTPFRVFAAQKNDLCYVLAIDRDGEFNH